MKRFCSVILAVFYICFASGVTMYQHYCMGELESISLYHGGDKECGKCGMKKHTAASKGCCKDVTLSSERSNDYHISSEVPPIFNTSVLVTPSIFYCTITPVSTEVCLTAINQANGPPLIKQPLFLQYENFRI